VNKAKCLCVLAQPYHQYLQQSNFNLQRTLRNCSFNIKSFAYNTYVKPIVEYASVVWLYTLYKCRYIYTIEMVQWRVACFVFNNFSSYPSVTTMLNKLKSLEKEEQRIFL